MMTERPSAANCRRADHLDLVGEYENMVLRLRTHALAGPPPRTPVARPFTRHYVHVPTCGASRAALLRGQRPSRPVHLTNNAIRDTQTEWAAQSLPGWFRQHGYRTFALGKITHYPGWLTGTCWAEGPEELPGVWDRAWLPSTFSLLLPRSALAWAWEGVPAT